MSVTHIRRIISLTKAAEALAVSLRAVRGYVRGGHLDGVRASFASSGLSALVSRPRCRIP